MLSRFLRTVDQFRRGNRNVPLQEYFLRRKITFFPSGLPQLTRIGLLVISAGVNMLSANAQLHIHGTTVSVSATVELTVLGDLETHAATPQGEAPLILEGRVRLHGQLTDHTDAGVIRPGSTGTLELRGSADQTLLGKARLYLPTLELRKTGGQVIAGTRLDIARQLQMNSATVLNATGEDIRFTSINARLVGEAIDRYVSGAGASLTGPTGFFLASESTSTDLLGMGLSVGTIGGAAVDPFRLKRVHRTEDGVGKQGSILRVYEIEAGNPSQLSNLVFSYLPHEVPAGFVESRFQLFASQDNGATWMPLDATLDAAANTLTVSGYALAQGSTWLTVAESCDPVTPAITSSKALQNGVVNQCPGENIILSYEGTATAYHWSLEGNSDTLALNSNLDTSAPGRYRLTVRTSRGCVFTNMIEIVPQSNPVLDISFNPDPATQLICLGTEVDFSVTSDQPLSMASWDLDGFATDGENVSYTFASEGNKNISITGTSQFGCLSTISETLRLLPLPTAAISLPNNTFCQEETIPAEATAELEFEGSRFSLQYAWSYESFQGNASTFEPTANIPGQNRLGLVVEPTLPHAGCRVTLEEFVTVNHKPVAAFQVRKDDLPVSASCEGEYVELLNQSTVGDNATMQYAWDFGDGRVSTVATPAHQFLTAATRTVRLIATSTSTGCADTLTRSHVVNEVPKGQFFLSDNRLCLGDTLLIQNDSYTQNDPFTSRWSFGDGSTQVNDQDRFSYTYGLAGDYRIRLERTTSNGCSNSIERIVSVYNNPDVDFAIDQTACAGDLITSENLTKIDRGTISHYQWYVDEQLISTSTNFSRVFTAGTGIKIKLLASTNQGCQARKIKTMEVRNNFNLSDIHSLYCQDTAQIDLNQIVTPSISDAVITWRSPYNAIIGTSPIQKVTESGLHSVSIADEYCQTELLLPVTLAFARNQVDTLEICDEQLFDPDFSIAPVSVQWSVDGAEVSRSSTILLGRAGIHALTADFEVENESCSYSTELQVSKIDGPYYDFDDTIVSCAGETVTLTADDSTFDYQWKNLTTGELISSNSITVEESVTLQIAASKKQCNFTDTIKVEFAPKPLASFTQDQQSYCQGDSAILINLSFDPSGQLLSYRWLVDGIFLSEADNPIVVLSDASSREIELSVTSQYGCASTVSRVLRPVVFEPVMLEFDQPCTDTEVFFEIPNEDNAAEYRWIFEDGQFASGAQVSKKFEQPGLKLVSLTIEKSNCRLDSLFFIDVQKPLDRPFESSYATCSDSLLLEYSGEDRFTWVATGPETVEYQGNSAIVRDNSILFYALQNDQGCFLRDSVIIEVGGLPTDFLPDSVGSCTDVKFELPFVQGASYQWVDGFKGRDRLIRFSDRYAVNISTGEGCESADTVFVDVDRIPTFDFPATVKACDGEIVQFDIPLAVENFRWSDGHPGRNLQVETSTRLSLVISNKYCIDTLYSEVIFDPNPDLELPTDSQICHGESFEIVLPENQLEEYTWFVDEEPVLSGKTFWIRPEFVGSSNIVVEATNRFGCAARDSLQLIVNPKPDFNLSTEPTCEGDTAFFDVLSNPGEELSFDWDSYVRASNRTTYSFYSPNYNGRPMKGNILNEFGCTTPVIVKPKLLFPPSFSFEDQLLVCGDSLNLYLEGDYNQVLWSNGDENLATTYYKNGLEHVFLVGQNGCQATSEFQVKLNKIEEGQLDDHYEVCGPLELAIRETDNSILWERNSSILSRSERISVAQSGTFTLRLADDNGCTYEHDFSVEVKENPVLTLQDQYSVCGDYFEFQIDSSELSTLIWQDGNLGFRRVLSQPGQYVVEALSPNGCAVTDSFELLLQANPPDILPDSIANCGFLTISIPDSLNVLWSNQSISNSRLIHESGQYWAKVSNQEDCEVVDSVLVTINPVPEIELGPDRTLCHGELVELRVQDHYESISWNSGQSGDFINVNAPGTYWVEVSNSFGCVASDVINIDYRPRLIPALGGTKYICSTDGLWLTTSLLVENYQWFIDEETLSKDDSLLVTEPGEYILEVVDRYGCVGTESVRVAESGNPIEASFLVSSVARPGEDLLFSLLTEPLPSRVEWDFGDGTSSDQFYPMHRYLTTGVKSVILEVFNEQCLDSESKEILITDQDIIEFSNDSSQLILKRIEISPNPTIDILRIDLELNSPGNAELFVFDVLGNERTRLSKLIFEDSLFLDLDGFNPGVYFLFVQVGHKVIMRRIIKI